MNPCSPDRCHRGATCAPTADYTDYTCDCGDGWRGRHCDVDVDECALTSPCENGAHCENTAGSFVCHCGVGYDGALCDINPDDCLEREWMKSDIYAFLAVY